jgi:hypothetical protein
MYAITLDFYEEKTFAKDIFLDVNEYDVRSLNKANMHAFNQNCLHILCRFWERKGLQQSKARRTASDGHQITV